MALRGSNGRGRGGNKAPRPEVEPLALYWAVVDTACVRGWRVDLFHVEKPERWAVEIRADRAKTSELLFKASTGQSAPDCWRILGSKLKTSMERSKLLDE